MVIEGGIEVINDDHYYGAITTNGSGQWFRNYMQFYLMHIANNTSLVSVYEHEKDGQVLFKIFYSTELCVRWFLSLFM